MHLTERTRRVFLVGCVSSLVGAGCGIAVKRDLSAIPVGQVGYDDMCGLQDYFDTIAAGDAKDPVLASSIDLEGGDGEKTVRGGKVSIVFEGEFLLKNARRVLEENWRRLPPELATTDRIQFDVRWAERAGVKRLVTTQDAEIVIDGRTSYLPYQVCLSELLFGAPLYRQRQVAAGLPDPRTKKPLDLALDAGAPEPETTIVVGPDAGTPGIKPAPPAKAAPPASPPAAPAP